MWVTLPSAFRSRWRRIFGSSMTQWSRRDVLADTNDDCSARGRGANPSFTSRFHTGTEIRAGAAGICAPSRGAHQRTLDPSRGLAARFSRGDDMGRAGSIRSPTGARIEGAQRSRNGVCPTTRPAGRGRQGLLRGSSVFCECYMFHRSSRTLILCDAVQDLGSAKLPPVTHVIARLAGGTQAPPHIMFKLPSCLVERDPVPASYE